MYSTTHTRMLRDAAFRIASHVSRAHAPAPSAHDTPPLPSRISGRSDNGGSTGITSREGAAKERCPRGQLNQGESPAGGRGGRMYTRAKSHRRIALAVIVFGTLIVGASAYATARITASGGDAITPNMTPPTAVNAGMETGIATATGRVEA